jgi:hypothetical protein
LLDKNSATLHTVHPPDQNDTYVTSIDHIESKLLIVNPLILVSKNKRLLWGWGRLTFFLKKILEVFPEEFDKFSL